jgi:ribonuclease HI
MQELSLHCYQIILIQSLNVKENRLPKLDQFYFPPIFNAGVDGRINTAIYFRVGLQYCSRPSPVPKETEHVSSCAAVVKFNSNCIINVASVYLPRGQIESNTDWLQSISGKEKWVIGGDFNEHSPLWENDCIKTTSNRFVENIIDSPFYLLNDGNPTRIPDNSIHRPTAIDLTLISPDLVVNSVWNILEDNLGSDHFPLITSINENIDEYDSSSDVIPKFNYKRANWEKFNKLLLEDSLNDDFDRLNNDIESLETDIDNNKVDNIYETLCSHILKMSELAIPKLKSSDKKACKSNAWWSKECDDAVKDKKDKYKAYIKNKTNVNFEAMKFAKIKCNKVIAKAKREHFNAFCNSEVSEPADLQKVWRQVNIMKNGVKLPSCPIKLPNNEFPSFKDKANSFVDMFAKVSSYEGLSPEQKNYRVKEEHKEDYIDPTPQNSLYINSPLTLAEITDAIRLLPSKKTSVGADAISNEMLKHLPNQWIIILLKFFQKCWSNAILPSVWKLSIVVPLHKTGKSKTDTQSYRPIAITSHVCKLLEKIILNRLSHYCDKNGIIPNHQTGFRKGRSCVDNLVKLTTQIKQQFAKRKSVLATFFDISKAYDQVWHSRLLFKIKNAGISGHMFDFLKCFLKDRKMQTRIGNTYSNVKPTNMGIPQGSVIAPLLFNILTCDLSKSVSKNVTLVQYADDICMWMKVNMKKKSPKRLINYIKKTYQIELDNLSNYMKENGLQFSSSKTNMMLFNCGFNPDELPCFKLDQNVLNYVQSVKFLGVYLNSKLSWKDHVDYILTKARKSLNFLKIVSKYHWGQDISTLIHLSTSLIRSKLTYAQEILFSAPNYLLKRLLSIDCKGYKLALGLPVHTSNLKTYAEAGVLPLDQYREFSSAKYLLKSQALDNNMNEISIRSDKDFPKRSKDIKSYSTIATYTKNILRNDMFSIDEINVAQVQYVSPVPTWELIKADFDIDYTTIKKDTQPHVLAALAKSRLFDKYPQHLKIYTDGSVTDGNNAGSAFIIPALDARQSFYLGKDKSIFTAELVAILMGLTFISECPKTFFKLLVCVDSKSVLMAIQNINLKVRSDLILDIVHLIHSLSMRGIDISFFWLPSHCGIHYNEQVDLLAKSGAKNAKSSIYFNIPMSLAECYHKIETSVRLAFNLKAKSHCNSGWKQPIKNINKHRLSSGKYVSRSILTLMCRWKNNSFKTKFVQNVSCLCGNKITPDHLLVCDNIKQLTPVLTSHSINNIFSVPSLRYELFSSLLSSPIGLLL